MQTSVYRVGKQQGPTVGTGNSSQHPVTERNGIEYEKIYIYMCITESLLYSRNQHIRNLYVNKSF